MSSFTVKPRPAASAASTAASAAFAPMYSRAQLLVPVAMPANRGRDDSERVGHLLVGQLEELRRGDRAAEGDDLRGVQTGTAAAPRVADPAGRLVADDHRAEQILPRGPDSLADGEAGGRERGAFMGGVADVAVVGRGRVAQRGVDPGGFTHRQPGAIEPDSWLPACRPAPSPGREGCGPSRSASPARRWRTCSPGSSSRARSPSAADRGT